MILLKFGVMHKLYNVCYLQNVRHVLALHDYLTQECSLLSFSAGAIITLREREGLDKGKGMTLERKGLDKSKGMLEREGLDKR